MGAQPKLRPGVALLAREDLPSLVAVMLTRTVYSLLSLSCLFSGFRRCFLLSLSAQHVFKLPHQVSRVQECVPSDFCLRQSRNCLHNCSTSL